MRLVFIAPLIFLSGCAGLAEQLTNSQTASDRLRSQLGADIDLQGALRRNIARKNAELEFISYGTYSCGPDSADYKKVTVYTDITPKIAREQAVVIAAVKKKKLEYLRNKYADFETIVAYGEALSALTKARDERVKAYANPKKLIAAYQGFVPSEFALVLKVMNDAVGLAQIGDQYAFQVAVIKTAAFAEEPLKKAREKVLSKALLKDLTDDEAQAFKEWESCALDRLFFYREYNPSMPPSYLERKGLIENTAGETRSPTLLFAAEYKSYLDEREAFVARRSDYVGLLDAIIEQNAALAHLPAGASFNQFLETLTQIGSDAASAKEQYNILRVDTRT